MDRESLKEKRTTRVSHIVANFDASNRGFEMFGRMKTVVYI
jgi:hypothetical protein